MENFTPSMTCLTGHCAAVAPVAAHSDGWGTTPTFRNGRFGSFVRGVRVVAPSATRMQGTTVPGARQRTIAAATALLPIDATVMTDGSAGIRSWSPPV